MGWGCNVVIHNKDNLMLTTHTVSSDSVTKYNMTRITQVKHKMSPQIRFPHRLCTLNSSFYHLSLMCNHLLVHVFKNLHMYSQERRLWRSITADRRGVWPLSRWCDFLDIRWHLLECTSCHVNIQLDVSHSSSLSNMFTFHSAHKSIVTSLQYTPTHKHTLT